MKLICALFALFLTLVLATAASAADRYTVVRLINTCAGQPANSYVPTDLSMNGGPVQDANTSFSVTPGSNSFHFTLKPFDGSKDSWIIKEIAQVDSNTNERTVLSTPNAISTILNYNVAEPTLEETVLILDVTVDTCARKVKLKIATTTSCTGTNGENFVVQGGVAVRIGDQTFYSNDKGVIETEVPVGVYDISASWFDAAFSYVAQNGAPQRNKEDGTGAVRLSEQTETLEVRLASCDTSGREIARATITEIGPNATIMVKRSRAEGRAFVGMALRDGDQVVVRGIAKITWANGTVVSFQDPLLQAVIIIGPDKEVPQGTKPPYRAGTMQILEGLGTFFIPKGEAPARFKFEASSNTVVLGVKGTEFVFGYDPQTGKSHIALTEGSLDVRPVNPLLPAFELSAGQQVTVSLTDVSPVTAIGGVATTTGVTTTTGPVPLSGVEGVPAGTYLGCFNDTSDLDLDGYLERSPTNTPEACFATCEANGFKYMGVQYGESCLCGNSFGRHGKADEAICNYGCTGRPDAICGGYNANSIYTTGN